MNQKRDILKEKSFAYAIKIVKLYRYLVEVKKEFVMSKQLLKSGTSVGANVREAKNAESGMDFIHKLAIAQKECDESLYWLELLKESGILSASECDTEYQDGKELLRILKSSILTKKQNLKKG